MYNAKEFLADRVDRSAADGDDVGIELEELEVPRAELVPHGVRIDGAVGNGETKQEQFSVKDFEEKPMESRLVMLAGMSEQSQHPPSVFGDNDTEAGMAGTQASAAEGKDEQNPSENRRKKVASIRNLYVASMSYNGYTFTDGALRLIVLLNAADLGFNAIEIAFMFTTYELAGVFTNLFGSLAGSKYGLRFTLLTSLFLQIMCLAALTQTEQIFGLLTEARYNSELRLRATIYITAWQTLAGVAKDLMKITGKSTPKLVTKEGQEGRLFKLVARVTGMKNAIKGVGSFIGSLLVYSVGYVYALVLLIFICVFFLPIGYFFMDKDLGKATEAEEAKEKFTWGSIFKKNHNMNILSLARFFLFGSRDMWFEVALPLYLRGELGWSEPVVGLFLAGYIITYGNLQAYATELYKKTDGTMGRPTTSSISKWAGWCAVVPLLTGLAEYFLWDVLGNSLATTIALVIGLAVFAGVFAINSSIHSYMVVSYSSRDKVSQDIGFYYMANAMGRLVGTLLGGFVFYYTVNDFGLSMVLFGSVPFLVAAAAAATQLRPVPDLRSTGVADSTEGMLLSKDHTNSRKKYNSVPEH